MVDPKSITVASPLLVPVVYEEQTYYTSQYFHRQYLANSQHRGKYQRHHDFVRLLRSMEAYQLYLDQHDIVEIRWDRIKTEAKQILLYWHPLFQAAGWHALILLNATAQVAMSHHLDDELSKQLSVTANTLASRQSQSLPSTSTQAMLVQHQLLGQALEHIALLEQGQERLQRQQDTQAAELAAIKDRQPPQGKLRPGTWLRLHGKPRLNADLMRHLNAACRSRETPQGWRPDGYDWPVPYFTPETIAAAYEEVTKQLSFIHDPGMGYHRSGSR